MSCFLVDTNILIYSEDGSDPVKRDQALDWLSVLWKRGSGRVSRQVLNEFYVNVTRKLRPPMSPSEARAEVRRYEVWQPWPIDHATVETAWAIESRYGLHYWDSLIVASAQHMGCRYILSENMAHQQQYGEVTVIDPFRSSVELLDA
jgi:predicted nucleic acid-binding protein